MKKSISGCHFRFTTLLIFHFRFQRISPKGRKQNFRGSPLKHFWVTTTLSTGQGQIKGSLVLQNQLETWLLRLNYWTFILFQKVDMTTFLADIKCEIDGGYGQFGIYPASWRTTPGNICSWAFIGHRVICNFALNKAISKIFNFCFLNFKQFTGLLAEISLIWQKKSHQCWLTIDDVAFHIEITGGTISTLWYGPYRMGQVSFYQEALKIFFSWGVDFKP